MGRQVRTQREAQGWCIDKEECGSRTRLRRRRGWEKSCPVYSSKAISGLFVDVWSVLPKHVRIACLFFSGLGSEVSGKM